MIEDKEKEKVVAVALLVEVNCPKHGFERFKVKVIKKFNIGKKTIIPVFRTRPKYELSGIIIGKNVNYSEAKEYLIKYFKETGMYNAVLRIKIQS